MTTRGHGFSLGLWSEEPVGQVMTRWRAFRTAFDGRFPTVVLAHQVHGARVRWHESAGEGWVIHDGVDGHATSAKGVLLTVTVADCIPVYLAVPSRGVMALLHAGWRGVAGRVLERGVEVLKQHTHAVSHDIVMHCGVGVCGTCYEVGSEVAAKLTGVDPGVPTHVDLRAVLAGQAAELGVGSVSVSPWCSAHDRERFYSHRGSQGRDGRMVAYLGQPLT
ncbi:MAG TPA: polyphenol oxidase family protein [Gemmatimonadales bacterium]|nr:polyphenol oxidase family protein [Gemmatimonadales bacterium]